MSFIDDDGSCGKFETCFSEMYNEEQSHTDSEPICSPFRSGSFTFLSENPGETCDIL